MQYGAGVRALVTKLSVDHNMPLEHICCLFADVSGYELNSETVETALEEGYELARPLEESIVEQLKQAEVVHFDETGLRIEGKLQMVIHGQQCLVHSLIRARETGRSSPAQRGVGLESVLWICGARLSGFLFQI